MGSEVRLFGVRCRPGDNKRMQIHPARVLAAAIDLWIIATESQTGRSPRSLSKGIPSPDSQRTAPPTLGSRRSGVARRWQGVIVADRTLASCRSQLPYQWSG
jgi:hypothetical protein